MFQLLIDFGLYIGDTDLAIVACRLYKDALAPSTKSSYSTGVNHLRRFTKKYHKIPFPVGNFERPSRLSISMIFFAAYLFEIDTIRSYSTIRNYMSQVKQLYLKRGYPEDLLESELLKSVMKGIKRCIPPKADTRIAILLIHYPIPVKFKSTKIIKIKKAVAAIVLGFFAMLRFHSYSKFNLANLTLVMVGGKEIIPSTCNSRFLHNLLHSKQIFGFYFTFDNKFNPGAWAYYCKLADLNRRLSPVCPLRHLSIIIKISKNGLFFPPNEITRPVLTQNMKGIACIQKNVKPHSLRIGGHTYYTVYGLDSDFRDYLARRKVKGATQTYYRASPALTIYQLRKFFDGVFGLPRS